MLAWGDQLQGRSQLFRKSQGRRQPAPALPPKYQDRSPLVLAHTESIMGISRPVLPVTPKNQDTGTLVIAVAIRDQGTNIMPLTVTRNIQGTGSMLITVTTNNQGRLHDSPYSRN